MVWKTQYMWKVEETTCLVGDEDSIRGDEEHNIRDAREVGELYYMEPPRDFQHGTVNVCTVMFWGDW